MEFKTVPILALPRVWLKTTILVKLSHQRRFRPLLKTRGINLTCRKQYKYKFPVSL